MPRGIEKKTNKHVKQTSLNSQLNTQLKRYHKPQGVDSVNVSVRIQIRVKTTQNSTQVGVTVNPPPPNKRSPEAKKQVSSVRKLKVRLRLPLSVQHEALHCELTALCSCATCWGKRGGINITDSSGDSRQYFINFNGTAPITVYME